MIDTTPVPETAILIGVINQDQDEAEVSEYLNELSFLTETAGAVPVREFTQKLDIPNPGTLSGKGNSKK